MGKGAVAGMVRPGIDLGPDRLRLVSGMSNHASPDLIRTPLLDLLEAVITESDDALPEFRRWCEAHIDVLEAIAFGHDHLPSPLSEVLSFEEALAFVRMQLDILDAVRSTTGLEPS